MKKAVEKKKKTEPEAATVVEKKRRGAPVVWVADDVADALLAWVQKKYESCKCEMVPTESGRACPVMTGEIPYMYAFCYEHKNQASGKSIGLYVYELAKGNRKLSEAIDMCRCARASKIDAGAMMGVLNAHYATAAQRQVDAGKFIDKQEVDLNAKVEGIDFTLNVIR